jgi:hypothetical protein
MPPLTARPATERQGRVAGWAVRGSRQCICLPWGILELKAPRSDRLFSVPSSGQMRCCSRCFRSRQQRRSWSGRLSGSLGSASVSSSSRS